MIGIDAGNSLDRPPTGVAIYARNLIRELAQAHPSQRFGWFYRSNRYFRSFRAQRPANASRRILEAPLLRLSARGLQLFHGLNQRLPPLVGVPTVATFHDLFAITGEFSTGEFKERFARLARETARRADHVIAVSSHTARQVQTKLGVPRSRITVVHHGVETLAVPSRARREQALAALGVAKPFVLHVGALQVRKNVERLVAAFEASGQTAQLVLAGSLGFGASRILERIRRSAVRDSVLLAGHVSDATRASLYAEAEALLFPSLDEGFGLPVIEAFSVGLPVITSDVSALPEVAGDAAVLVDPRNTDEIARGLQAVLEDPGLRSALRRKGLARASKFTWERCAEQTWRVYERLLRA